MIQDTFDVPGLPERPAKPREKGLTHMLDKGMALRQVEDVLSVAAEYIDLAKLGWGTAAVTPGVQAKIDLYREAGIPVYFGGTLFEAYHLRDALDTYRRLMERCGVEHLEVSDGTLPMAHEEKLRCIRVFDEAGFTVLSEVGSKDKEKVMPPYKWVRLIQAELEAGSWKVICESRETGTAGLFRPNGEIRAGLVDEIVDLVDRERVLFEAPNKPQQVWLIRHLGPNVNLGNIAPEEVIPLETLRLGLRGDTLFEFFKQGDLPKEVANG
jgi:phosphosulfolactate synthase